jgi:hypothetical protein
MKTSENKKVKEILSKLAKENKLTMPNLFKEIDFEKIDFETQILISNELKNANKGVKGAKESQSIYKLQNEYLNANKGVKLVKGTEEYKKFKGIRIKTRNFLDSFLNSSLPNKENKEKLLSFLKVHFTNPDLTKIESFIGESSEKERIQNWLNWLRIVNNLK